MVIGLLYVVLLFIVIDFMGILQIVVMMTVTAL